ncbi:MAG: aspartate aminotransferase family protein [Myxococcales bacterium]|nr:aspartate aminotransferase family protein [Myxococcales bacterium]
MALPSQGKDKDTLLAELQTYKGRDVNWQEGRTFAYVYDPGAEAMAVGKAAFSSFLTENALDPTVYPSLMRLENEIVGFCASHLNLPDDGVGTFTSGGTESILLAVKSARDFARQTRPEVTRPNMVLPVTAHAAFHKASSYFDVELVLVEVDPVSFAVTPEAMAAAIDEQTVLVVASSPGYAHGVMDPIAAIGAICETRSLPFHVDACVGGWMLPFWRRLQLADGMTDVIDAFDFEVKGVTSLSVDLHKYGFCPKGASVVLFRNKTLRNAAGFACSDWAGYTVVNPSVQSSKSGGPLAGAWSVMRFLGDEGYMAITDRLRQATLALLEGISAIDGLEIMGQPAMCMFAFTSTEFDVFHVADEMSARGWYVQPQLGHTGPTGQRYAGNVHLSLNSWGTLDRVTPFLADLQDAVQAARTLPDVRPNAEMGQMLQAMAGQTLSGDELMGMLGLMGVGAGEQGAELPERMAPINRILDAMPAKMNEAVLSGFMGELYAPAR